MSDTQRNADLEVKLYESFMQAIQSAINFSFLLNGGAAIAVLTIVGNFKDQAEIVKGISFATVFFSCGVVVASISALLLYMTQFTYFKTASGDENPFYFSGTTFRVLVVLFIFMSTILFSVGIYTGSRVFL